MLIKSAFIREILKIIKILYKNSILLEKLTKSTIRRIKYFSS